MGRHSRAFPLVLFVFALAFAPTAAVAWKASYMQVVSIDKAFAMAETGDYFAIEGEVASASGDRLFVIDDGTGEMKVVIPQYVLRDRGVPVVGERVRVSGKFDHKKLDSTVQGMRVAKLERLGSGEGYRGQGEGEASAAGKPTPPAAVTESPPPRHVVPGGTTPKPLMERLRLKRLEYEAATRRVDDAAAAYAKALYEAGEGGQVPPGIQEALRLAEAERGRVMDEIPPLVEQARRAGADPGVIELYEKMTGQRYE